MRRETEPDGPVRRTVLAGALGIAAGALTGCGIRLDRDPQMPELAADDLLRDAVARSLAAIEADTGPAAVGDAVTTFTRAVGPPWNPPADLEEPVAPPHPDPAPMDATAGLGDVARRVAESLAGLGTTTSATAAVLLDVTAGALLHLDGLDADTAGEVRSALAEGLTTAVQAAEEAAQAPTAEAAAGDRRTEDAQPDDGDRATGSATAAPTPAAALVTTCYAAEYAYERAAVHLPDDDPARSGTTGRVGRLQGVVAAVGALVPDSPTPSDRPAWDLPEDPHDAETARAAMRSAEDAVAAALLDARGSLPPAALAAWLDDSARARSQAGGAQDLRFEVDQQTQEDAA